VADFLRQSCTNLVASIKSEGALIFHLRTVTNTCKNVIHQGYVSSSQSSSNLKSWLPTTSPTCPQKQAQQWKHVWYSIIIYYVNNTFTSTFMLLQHQQLKTINKYHSLCTYLT